MECVIDLLSPHFSLSQNVRIQDLHCHPGCCPCILHLCTGKDIAV